MTNAADTGNFSRLPAGEQNSPSSTQPIQPDFQALFESIPSPCLALDPQLRVIAVSYAYASATMQRREDMLGRTMFDIFPDNPDDPSADGVRNLHASLQRVLRHKVADVMAVQKYDITRPPEQGGGFEVRYWNPVNSPVLDERGEVRYIIHRAEDITEFILLKEQRLAENRLTDSLREQAEKMEADIYARAKEVAESNDRLHQANGELARLYDKTRELDRLKTQFFANISHELRTPLTLILGPVAKQLAIQELPTACRRDLEVVERNARLLYRHVNDLLDVAKLEAGRMVLHYAEIDLARFTRVIVSHFESLAENRGIAYGAETPPTLNAQVDGEKFQRILLNLLSNAFKFVPDGGAIQVHLRHDQRHLHLQVQDNGPGIPEDMRQAVFEPFRQVEGGSTRQRGGTGLGLAIVRELAQLHGGTVHLEGSPGGGALFTLKLPLLAPAGTLLQVADDSLDPDAPRQIMEELALAAVPAAATAVLPAAGSAPLVLVVEDNPDMNSFIAEALGQHYRVLTARDGQEGLEAARAHRPDLIVSDMMMPRLNGEQMVQALRQEPALQDVPIVILTAKADEDLRIRLLQDGVQDYLNKPFSVDELQARVDGMLAERRQAANLLRESEARFRATFAQAGVGMAHVAPDGRWLLVNQRLCDITGYNREELADRTFQEITHPDDLHNDLEQVQRLLAGEIDSYSMEKRYLHQDGHIQWVNLTVSLVRQPDGSPHYFIAAVEDIQRRKAAEEEIRHLNADLEQRVEARTAELQAANKELDSFANAVSHDLRAPLRAMTGFSRAILEDYGETLEGDAREYLQRIVDAGKHMGSLIEGLLSLSRSTREQLQRERVDISAMAERILQELQRSAPERRVHWQVEGDLAAEGDPRMVEVVLQNLLGNAWKYTAHTATAEIRIYARRQPQQIAFCIADNGAGFDMAQANRLFQPFQRLHRQEQFPGIGIGLATVQRVVHRHGGSIHATATPGQGAEFCFTLPLPEELPAESPVAPA